LAEQAEWCVGGSPPGEERGRCRDGELTSGDLGEEIAEVGADGEIAGLEALLGGEAGPAAVEAAAAHAAAEDEHGGRVPVVGAAVAVLGHRAAELRHGE